ncbi:energy-coupling factor ABC transporter substrate-binding protein [Dehalobacter sp. DCM]|uniref:energy-coupling factor ABC transporter substrate-binding protein n=1 Tax=Dehalobacter sp. DCM TaxID=2907827 RepID=UPI003081A03E|nr:energy-coupling factor ABC transporter substrate-binding protein [Dehalobacter sp. DCM]
MSSSNNMPNNKSRLTTNLVLIAIVILLAIVPLVMNKNAEFGGADGQAETAITEINPEYTPWFSSIFEPPSGEIESLLFSLQAALGSGILFYGLGYMKGRYKREEKNKN